MHGAIRTATIGRGKGRTLVAECDMVLVGKGAALHVVQEEPPQSGERRTVCGTKGEWHAVLVDCDPRALRVDGRLVCGRCRELIGIVPEPRLADEGGATDDQVREYEVRDGQLIPIQEANSMSTNKTGKPARKAAPKKAKPAKVAVDVGGIEKALMTAVKDAEPGAAWTAKQHYQRLNVAGISRAVVVLWYESAALKLQFPDGAGSIRRERLGSLAEVPKGAKMIQDEIAKLRAGQDEKADAAKAKSEAKRAVTAKAKREAKASAGKAEAAKDASAEHDAAGAAA